MLKFSATADDKMLKFSATADDKMPRKKVLGFFFYNFFWEISYKFYTPKLYLFIEMMDEIRLFILV